MERIWDACNDVVCAPDGEVKSKKSFGAHAIMIKSHMYDHILEGINRFDKPLDVMYCDLQQRFKVYGFRRPLVKQASFTSDIIGFNAMYLEQGIFD